MGPWWKLEHSIGNRVPYTVPFGTSLSMYWFDTHAYWRTSFPNVSPIAQCLVLSSVLPSSPVNFTGTPSTNLDTRGVAIETAWACMHADIWLHCNIYVSCVKDPPQNVRDIVRSSYLHLNVYSFSKNLSGLATHFNIQCHLRELKWQYAFSCANVAVSCFQWLKGELIIERVIIHTRFTNK